MATSDDYRKRADLLAGLELATARREALAAQLREATDEQAGLVRAAMQAGTPVSDLMRVTGLSRPRIYQIRDEVGAARAKIDP